MRLRLSIFTITFALLNSGLAFAQTLNSASNFASAEGINAGGGSGTAGLSAKAMGTGLKVGEDSILHAGLGVSAGYDSNVLYQRNGEQKNSPVMYVNPYVELTNAERDGSVPSGIFYDLTAGASWREYLTSGLDRHRAINPTIAGTVDFSSGQKLSLTLADQFSRIELPPVGGDAEPIVMDLNTASAGLKFAPGGGRLRGLVRYSNMLSYYEGAASSASNMGNELVLDVGWNWLPRTAIYFQVSQGLITYFDEKSTRPSSYPLKALLGLRGLLTEKLALNLGAGYVNAFYDTGAGPSGFGNVAIIAELRYIITLLSQTAIGYRHDYSDSPFIGQFYSMDAIYAMYRQLIAARLVTYLYARYENRRFGGMAAGASRTDNVLSGSASVNYFLRTFLYAGLSYGLMSNQTTREFSAALPDGGIDYIKHTLLVNVGVVY